jgi:hypothetical protein
MICSLIRRCMKVKSRVFWVTDIFITWTTRFHLSLLSQFYRTHCVFICRYADNPSLLGIELLNEPSAGAVPLDILVSYYKRGYKIVRSYSETTYVIFCQRIGNADPMELYQADLGPTNTVVDLHYYNLFDPYYEKLNATENIRVVYKNRLPQVQALNSANGPLVFIGRFCNVNFNCSFICNTSYIYCKIIQTCHLVLCIIKR